MNAKETPHLPLTGIFFPGCARSSCSCSVKWHIIGHTCYLNITFQHLKYTWTGRYRTPTACGILKSIRTTQTITCVHDSTQKICLAWEHFSPGSPNTKSFRCSLFFYFCFPVWHWLNWQTVNCLLPCGPLEIRHSHAQTRSTHKPVYIQWKSAHPHTNWHICHDVSEHRRPRSWVLSNWSKTTGLLTV